MKDMFIRILMALSLLIGVIGTATATLFIIGWIVGNIKLPDISPKPMSNDNIIKETKKCHDAGLETITLRSKITGEIGGIQCAPITKGTK